MTAKNLKLSNITADNGLRGSVNNNNKPRVGGADVDDLIGVVQVDLSAADTAGGLFSIENDTGKDYIVTLAMIDVTTEATGACTADIGVAANATTSDDTLIDGVDVGAAAILANNVNNAGTNGGVGVKLEDGQFVTGSVASGASAGIVGKAYVQLVRA